LAALSHFYGLTFGQLRDLEMWELSVLIDVQNEAASGEKSYSYDDDPDEVNEIWKQ
jgi:hypothetical protein